MFLKFLSLSIVINLSLLGAVASADTTKPVRIVAANLTSGNAQSYEPGHGIEILKAMNPDIILIQEFNYKSGSDEDIKEMLSKIGNGYQYYREPLNAGRSIPNGVISRFPIKASGELKDVNIPDRDFAWARIDVPGDRDLWAFSAHFKASKDSKSKARRKLQAEALVNYITTSNLAGSSPISTDDFMVLGGDFNTFSKNPEVEPMLGVLSKLFRIDGEGPVDQNGNVNTNSSRVSPYDWVVPDTELAPLEKPVVFGEKQFKNGLVFDCRLENQAELGTQVAAENCAATNMQHMAVVRDFAINETVGTEMSTQGSEREPASKKMKHHKKHQKRKHSNKSTTSPAEPTGTN